MCIYSFITTLFIVWGHTTASQFFAIVFASSRVVKGAQAMSSHDPANQNGKSHAPSRMPPSRMPSRICQREHAGDKLMLEIRAG